MSETEKLASYAARENNSKGRRHQEGKVNDRTEFQRDCTRIIHSQAFRKLQYKTQVFPNDEGDLFRTRLTHSMEVAQISRSVARELYLNQDLAETLALAHDLGHAPFGHTGQDVLDALMAEHGGFEHNLQGLKIVDEFESPYLDFKGLNLLFETREGILKHCQMKHAKDLGDIGERFIKKTSPSLEAQLVNWCDAIGYTHSDLEDCLKHGLTTVAEVSGAVPLFGELFERAAKSHPSVSRDDPRLYQKAIGDMMKMAIADLISQSAKNIEESGVKTIEDVRASKELIGFSPDFLAHHRNFKKFSRSHLYNHERISSVREKQEEMLKTLFKAYEENPSLMGRTAQGEDKPLQRRICDYIAGMTDRYATQEYKRISVLCGEPESPSRKRSGP